MLHLHATELCVLTYSLQFPPLVVYDPDEGVNSLVSLTLLMDMEGRVQPLSVNESTGQISTTLVLDREGGASFDDMQLVATDGGGLQSDPVSLTLVILDINDHTPEISVSGGNNRLISEDTSTGSVLAALMFSDADEDTVSFSLEGGDGDFEIEADTGVIMLVNFLDRETREEYLLNVMAVDSGLPMRNTSLLLQVTVLDVNDNAPVFEQVDPVFSITENIPLGTVIGVLNVSDADAGLNGQVQLTILEGNEDNRFTLSETGEISTIRAIDREVMEAYQLLIQVC